ncbi:MAG: type I DNA topoisomerase [Anaerolineae bacterium]|nr:type I DNA topoisomerase [Anaerolineae bacterium]
MSKPKAKRLLIVESPGKVKKIQSYLGAEFRVMASMGHVRDLPSDELGIDVEAGFVPKWEVVAGKNNVIKRLVKAMNDTQVEAIYLATDPDREGEAIAAHILSLTKLPREKPVMRVTFTAITQEVVRKAVENPRRLDMALVAAQHARRKLDRLVGYLISPIACRVLDGRYSAGRVQSPALRLVVERERAVQSFTPEIYFVIEALLGTEAASFKAKLTAVQGKALPLKDMELVKKLAATLNSAAYWVGEINTETVTRKPPAPFTTSTLQQAASSTLGFSPEQTMQLAQTLYETSLITYMRTDAVFIAPEAQVAAFDFIGKAYGEPYLPTEKPQYKSKPNAQEAHEAVRPTDITLTPDQIKENIGDGAALYGLIWRRFVASQMAAAVDTIQTVSVLAGKQMGQPFPLTLTARGSAPQFDGFRRVYQVDPDVEADEPADAENALPVLAVGQMLTLQKLLPQQKQTQAPARFTEAQLVHELEKRGIGRPSTYAAILSNLKSREYVRLDKKRLIPTETGIKLTNYLMDSFTTLLADDYTARMENTLDEIAGGQRGELDVLQAFWGEFQPLLRGAAAAIRPTQSKAPQPELQKTGEQCPQCGSDLVIRAGKNGQFVGCSAFPKCRYTVGLEYQPLILQPMKP